MNTGFLNIYKFFLFIFIILIILYIFSFFLIPFKDYDTIVYSLLGSQIINFTSLENLFFDHKPFYLNLIYGLSGLLIYGYGQSTFVSIICILLTSFFIKKFLLINNFLDRKFSIILIYLVSFYAITINLSGNSELIVNLLIILSFYFLISSHKTNQYFIHLFLSGLFASIAFQTNYISGFIIFFPTIYIMLILNKNIFKTFTIYILGLLLPIIFFLIYSYLTNSNLSSYYKDIFIFYKNYNTANFIFRLFYLPKEFYFYLLIFLPIVLMKFKDIHNDYKFLSYFLIIWLFSSFISILIAGHNLIHYFSYVILPITIFFLIINNKKPILEISPYHIPIFLFCCFFIFENIYVNYQNHFEYKNFKKQILILEEKILEDSNDLKLIATGPLPIYLSNFHVNNQRFITTSAPVYFRNEEYQYWLKLIKTNPKYIFYDSGLSDCNCQNYHLVDEFLKSKYDLFYTVDIFHPFVVLKNKNSH